MKNSSLRGIMGFAGLAAGICLVQGCSTVHSRGTAEAGEERLRPLPGALEPAPVEVVTRPAALPATPSAPAPVVDAAALRQSLTTPYTVKPGDTISGIAYCYGLRWQDVMAVNPGVDPKRLRAGQVIQLPGKVDLSRPVRALPAPRSGVTARPAAGGDVYTVRRGDTLSHIARRFNVTVEALREANRLQNDMIREGQKLTIPGAGKTAPSSPPSPPPPPAIATPPPAVPELPPLPLPDTGSAAPVVAPPPLPADVPPPAPAAGEVKYQTYTVKPGEDLYSVAVRWGVGFAELKALNNLSGPELAPGTVLKIPPAPAP